MRMSKPEIKSETINWNCPTCRAENALYLEYKNAYDRHRNIYKKVAQCWQCKTTFPGSTLVVQRYDN